MEELDPMVIFISNSVLIKINQCCALPGDEGYPGEKGDKGDRFDPGDLDKFKVTSLQ
jgi:hypothetical protein